MSSTDWKPRTGIIWCCHLALALACLTLGSDCLVAAGTRPEQLMSEARQFLDAGRAEEAIERLDVLARKTPKDAEVYLLRSSARFMLGEIEPGRQDLVRALEIDPGLRQAWLNRAALDLAEKKYDEAVTAFTRAGALDPQATDTELNIGVALLLKGDLAGAQQHFGLYLQRSPGSADAFYLVASNYAMAGQASAAIANLERAIALDELSRVRSRTDPNFAEIAAVPEYQVLLNTDNYQPLSSDYSTVREFDVPYLGAEGGLFGATMTTLQLAQQPIVHRAEVTPTWALIWADVRIKVTTTPEGKGQLQVSAPLEAFTPSEWLQRVESLFRDVSVRSLSLKSY